MRINDLTQFHIEAVEDRDNFLSKFREKGISNAKKLKEINSCKFSFGITSLKAIKK